MFDRFTERARYAVVRAQELCRELVHPRVGTEHLLLGVLDVREGLGAWALESLGLGWEAATGALATLAPPDRTPPAAAVPFTPGARCALERSLIEVQSRGLVWVGTEHLLLGVCAEIDDGDGVARRLLAELGATTAEIRTSLDPYIPQSVAALEWSLRRTPALEFRDLPGAGWDRLLPLRIAPALRRLLLDGAAVALDGGRRRLDSVDLLVASGERPDEQAPTVRDWTRIAAGPGVLSALVAAAREASRRGAEAVTVADLSRSLRADQRSLLERVGGTLDPPCG